MNKVEDRLLRIPEVAQRLGLSKRWVDTRIADGRIASVKLGYNRRVRESEVARIMAEGMEPKN